MARQGAVDGHLVVTDDAQRGEVVQVTLAAAVTHRHLVVRVPRVALRRTAHLCRDQENSGGLGRGSRVSFAF